MIKYNITLDDSDKLELQEWLEDCKLREIEFSGTSLERRALRLMAKINHLANLDNELKERKDV